jgi:hypothetical protein
MAWLLVIDPEGRDSEAMTVDYESLARDYVREKKITKSTLVGDMRLPVDVERKLTFLLQFADHWDAKGAIRLNLNKYVTAAWQAAKLKRARAPTNAERIFSMHLNSFMTGMGATQTWEDVCKALADATRALAQRGQEKTI